MTEQVFKYLPDWLAKFLSLQWLPDIRWLRRVIVAVMGFTVLLIGLAMVVLPGPALVVIPLGFAILATEFVWARRVLKKAKSYYEKGKKKLKKAKDKVVD
jgi:tellurite resistance protein TerC